MALPGQEGDALGPREESLEVHPAGEEFLPAVAVRLMNLPTDGAAALRPLLSRSCAPAPPADVLRRPSQPPPVPERNETPKRDQGDSMEGPQAPPGG